MMKNLILGAAAGAFLLSAGTVYAKDKPGQKKAAKLPKTGSEADCDDSAKASLDALGQAREKLKASSYSGKAAGGFGEAQKAISHAEAQIKKGCSFAKGNADKKADATQSADQKK
jgi:hypothetical protein